MNEGLEQAEIERPGGVEAWRCKVLDRGSAVFALLFVLLFAFIATRPVLRESRFFTWAIFACLALTGLVSVRRSWPYRVRAHLFVTTLLLLEAICTYRTGYFLGTPMCGMLAVVAAGLLLGVRGAIGVWILSTLIIVAAAFAFGSGTIQSSFTPDLVDPNDLIVGLRFAAVYGTMTVILAVGVSILVSYLARSLEQTSGVVRELQQEKRERERVEEEKRAAQDAFHRAQKLELIGRLASGVAHDFNNSLTVVMGWAELLDDDHPDLQEEATREIKSACQHSAGLASQLLMLGRREVHAPAPLDPSRVVEILAQSLRQVLPTSVELEIRCEQVPSILGDEDHMHQILLNLALNARDAMPDGGTLAITVRPAADDDHAVCIEVADTGCGMSEEVRARIFEPFFSTKPEEQGTGLGLTTVRELVEENGGTLDVESREGEGTRFRIQFPCSEEAEDPRQPEAPLPASAASEVTVLVVDDDERLRRMVKLTLERAGYRVLEAADGREALELARSAPDRVDLLWTDAVMPRMGARELLEEFERSYPDARQLLCSAYVDAELLRQGIQTRSIPFLRKPFTRAQALSKVAEVLGEADSSTPSG